MSRPCMSTARLARRLMHTGGRRIPNPGEGGAPSYGSVSPHTVAPGPSSASSSTTTISPADPAMSPAPRYTPKSKPIPARPARTIPVSLPNGDPEPTSYPPDKAYFDTLEANRVAPHPLWQFFHVDSRLRAGVDAAQTGPRNDMGSLETLEGDDDNLRSGRAWTAAELRTKTFAELHTLWYVLVKERNVLATQREERRRLGLHTSEGGDLITKRTFRCRKSMARIKYVLNERRLGIMAVAEPDIEAELAEEMAAELDLAEEGGSEQEAVVQDGQVGKEEVEARDEGFGGGQEAKQFVDEVKVEQGHVGKKD